MAEQTGTQNGGAAQGGGPGTTVVVQGGAQGAGAGITERESPSGRRAAQSEHTERMIAKYGSTDRALDVLGAENYDYRDAARKDAETIATLKRAQVPEGAVVLTGADKDAWDKIKATATKLNLTPDKVAAEAETAATLKAEKATAEKTTARSAAARDAKLNPDVLNPLLDQFGYDVESRPEKMLDANNKLVDGKVVYVRKADDAKAAWEKLGDLLNKDGSPFKPFAVALKAGVSATQNGSTSSTATTPQGGTSHVFPDTSGDTSSSSNSDGGDPITKRLKARNDANASRPNPLMAPAPVTKTT